MKIAKQGWKIILTGIGVGAFGFYAARCGYLAGWPLGLLGAGFAAFSCYFFRDPDRPLPADERIYSPGDGRVLSVAREGPGDITTVRIFLSVFDVHVQRLPCSGVVNKVHYQPGAFAMAMKDEAKLNERNVVRIAVAGRKEEIPVEQIAGYVARRILCWVKEGDRAVAGERYGLIQFGSQAAVHLPGTARALVKPGDRVVGGVTPIAEWTKAG